jgi:hypothetical protein
VQLPKGWDAQIVLHRTDPATADLTGAAAPPTELAVLHAASFRLPVERGDYGSGAVEAMDGSDVLICLLEHDPADADAALFRHQGVPHLSVDDFSPQSMQRAIAGMSGSQHFFVAGGRPFCLYVVVGSHRTRGPLVRQAEAVVRTIEVDSIP